MVSRDQVQAELRQNIVFASETLMSIPRKVTPLLPAAQADVVVNQVESSIRGVLKMMAGASVSKIMAAGKRTVKTRKRKTKGNKK